MDTYKESRPVVAATVTADGQNCSINSSFNYTIEDAARVASNEEYAIYMSHHFKGGVFPLLPKSKESHLFTVYAR